MQRARDEHELYFRAHPHETDREYLLAVFDGLARLPGTREGIFGEHNPMRQHPGWLCGRRGQGPALAVLPADRRRQSGKLVHDFTDPDWDTRFLGDLYQDLSEAARKKYALLQTPVFVEEFILDRTLETGHRDSSGWTRFGMIDPACGSGHFLLGSFRRLLDHWQRREPGTNIRELVQRALDGIHGVDINPYAVAIARFRLLLAAMQACGVTQVGRRPGVPFQPGVRRLAPAWQPGGGRATLRLATNWTMSTRPRTWRNCVRMLEAGPLPRRGRQSAVHHAQGPGAEPDVPRAILELATREYSLAVPFMQRIFDSGAVAQAASPDRSRPTRS